MLHLLTLSAGCGIRRLVSPATASTAGAGSRPTASARRRRSSRRSTLPQHHVFGRRLVENDIRSRHPVAIVDVLHRLPSNIGNNVHSASWNYSHAPWACTTEKQREYRQMLNHPEGAIKDKLRCQQSGVRRSHMCPKLVELVPMRGTWA